MDIIDLYIKEKNPKQKQKFKNRIKNMVQHEIEKSNSLIRENPQKWVYWNSVIDTIED